MRYFGSKATLTDTIFSIIHSRLETGSLCDPFGGIGTVGSFMRSRGYDVWSGDVLSFAHYYQIAKIKYPHQAEFTELLRSLDFQQVNQICLHMNNLTPCVGWFVNEYSENRCFFTRENAMRIEACRNEIEYWDSNGLLNYDEKAILIAGLINSMDKVANTAGTYYAYLKSWHRKALKLFTYDFILPQQTGSYGCCYLETAEQLLDRKKFDIIYLDPPYNERSYAHYYHLPETIAQGTTPSVHGKSGIPDAPLKFSHFNKKKLASTALANLLDKSKFKFLLFHYADNGLITPNAIEKVLSLYGKIEKMYVSSKGYYTGNGSKTSSHKIYLVTNEQPIYSCTRQDMLRKYLEAFF